MGSDLDLDDAASGHPRAQGELVLLRYELRQARAAIRWLLSSLGPEEQMRAVQSPLYGADVFAAVRADEETSL